VSREHVFPESVGNEDLVCLRVLFATDATTDRFQCSIKHYCDLHPINLRRTLLGIPNRNGTIPTVRYSVALEVISGAMEATRFWKSDRRLRLAWSPPPLNSKTDAIEVTLKGSGGRRMTEKYAAQLFAFTPQNCIGERLD